MTKRRLKASSNCGNPHRFSFKHLADGNAVIEFSLILPVFLLLTLATVDFGLVIVNKVYLRTAVNAGIQYAMSVSPNTEGVTSAIQNATPLTGLTVTVSESCKCANNVSVSCTGTCTGATTSPDKYLSLSAQTNVSLTGTYGLLENPFPLTETAIVMVP